MGLIIFLSFLILVFDFLFLGVGFEKNLIDLWKMVEI